MGSTVIPALRYNDAKRAVQWVQDAFGFEAGLVVEDDDGRVVHAQLCHGDGMVMLSSAGDGAYDELVAAGGVPSVGLFVVIDDVIGHCERAREAGAEIVMEPEPQEYGGELYTCRDFEGFIWSFGSYDPWA